MPIYAWIGPHVCALRRCDETYMAVRGDRCFSAAQAQFQHTFSLLKASKVCGQPALTRYSRTKASTTSLGTVGGALILPCRSWRN